MSRLREAVALLEQGNWQAAHGIVQEDESVPGCWAHGIVHLMEGDRDNAAYWYRRAQRPLSATPDIAAEIAALGASLR